MYNPATISDRLNDFTEYALKYSMPVYLRNGTRIDRIALYKPECDTEEEFIQTVDEKGEPDYKYRWYLCGKSIQKYEYDMVSTSGYEIPTRRISTSNAFQMD